MDVLKILKFLTGGLVLIFSSQSFAAVVDTIDASDSQAGTFFVPSPGQESSSPYFRFMDEDWGWTHNGIASGFTSATLSISAFDVDNPSAIPGRANELDLIQAFDTNATDWVTLGELSGASDIFSFTSFNLANSWFDEITAGLQVRMLIDENDTNFWGVSLAKSVITTDGAPLPNPNPGVVPVPAAVWLFGTALIGLVGFSKRRKTT